MTTLAIAGGGAFALLASLALGFWWVSRQARKRGESEAKVKQSEKVLDNVAEAQKAERDLDDPDQRDSVRTRFTRK